MTVTCFDLKHLQKDPPKIFRGGKLKRKHKVVKGRVLVRDPKNVTGITFHQAAAKFSARRRDKKRFKDPQRALAERALEVACHTMAFDGFYVLANPLLWHVYQGNGFNPEDLGYEIDGNFPGEERLRKKKHSVLTERRIMSARAGVERTLEDAGKIGCDIGYAHGHRQSSAMRRPDPGEVIWKAVVLDFAVAKMGLKLEEDRTLGRWRKGKWLVGKPIPTSWGGPAGVKY